MLTPGLMPSYPSYLLPLSLLVPLLTALVVPCFRGRIRNILVVAAPLGSFLLLLSLYPSLGAGREPSLAWGGFASPLGFTLGLDNLSFILALLTTLVWTLASLYALEYMSNQQNQGRFFIFLLLALVATLGVFLAADLVTLLLFFEAMTLTAYVLVIHKENGPALAAGRLYLFLGVLAGLLLLLGITVLAAAGQSLSLSPGHQVLTGHPGLQVLVAFLFIIGFGIKAGMVPLHIWLPEAHPVAPTPASALLSGIMIKIGAYGIFRTLSLFFPAGPAGDWTMASQLGLGVVWFGIITMFTGVVMALLQENMKRMLACHSISQMGYILAGIGAAAYLGQAGAPGMAGGFYHIINHALFKSALFLTAGMVYLKTRDLHMYNLGGLWRRLPFTTLVAVLAALGISGFPGLNGFASKTLLHHSLLLAAGQGHYTLLLAEKIFVLTGAGTAASMLKLIYYTYLRHPAQPLEIKTGEGWPARVSMGILALALIIIGLRPGLLLERFLVPAIAQFPFAWEIVEHELLPAHFWTLSNFQEIGFSLLLGVVIFAIGSRSGIFHRHPPCWCSFHWLAAAALKGLLNTGKTLCAKASHIQQQIGSRETHLLKGLRIILARLDPQPGESPLYNQICIANMDFDTLLVFSVLAMIFLLYTPRIILAGGL